MGECVVWCVGTLAGGPAEMREPVDPRPEDVARRLGRELSALGLVLRLTGIGWYVAVCIGGGAMLGYWADGRFDTRPALTIAGLVLGVVVAFSGMISMLRAVLAARSRSGTKARND